MIHLDTNAAIALLNGRPARIRERFDTTAAAGHRFALSTIAFHELHYGAAASGRPLENARKIDVLLAAAGIELLPVEPIDAVEAADIRAALKRAGTPIGPYDLLIAAQARRTGAMLVTANAREFARVPGLATVDWAL